MNAGQDGTVVVGTWLDDKFPKWHDKCRNWYTNTKSYTYAQTKRHQKESAADSVQPLCSRPTSSEKPHTSHQQNTPIFK